jgi:hypothetical protein
MQFHQIARLNPNGTLDTAFNPSPDNSVDAIAVQADGKILAGGAFTSMGGQTRNSIARLDPTTGLADSFNPNAIRVPFSPTIHAIAVQPDGKIVVGGEFDIIGQNRKGIACLDPSTGLADSFNANANATTGR